MKYLPTEILQFIEEEDVKFIRLAFCDVYGVQKNISIMPSELHRAFSAGIAIDASAIAGFGGEVHSDLFLHPDPDTISVLPWRPEHGRVVRMFCSVKYPDGSVFENDARNILKKAISDAAKSGYSFSFGPEMEFYLFMLDENGLPTKQPYDNAGYMDIAPEDKGENVRREICLTLERMGIQPESSHHEEGPGQNEIDFRYSDALSAADNAVTFKNVVRTIAARNGLFADFSPKPLTDYPGNGMHVNISVKDREGKDLMNYMMAGILDKMPDITIFMNPIKKSYERLGHDKAPKYVSWSAENRSQLIRIPAACGEYRRAELRSPDPSANPYLVFALLIYAGIYGIENRLELPPEEDSNLYTADIHILSKYKKLPETRLEAAKIAAKSDFLHSILPEMLINTYCK
ncbi:MAG: glutamine synthetase family protein [Lachnospiraceae bacterium]|jgi:glutamine synthetase